MTSVGDTDEEPDKDSQCVLTIHHQGNQLIKPPNPDMLRSSHAPTNESCSNGGPCAPSDRGHTGSRPLADKPHGRGGFCALTDGSRIRNDSRVPAAGSHGHGASHPSRPPADESHIRGKSHAPTEVSHGSNGRCRPADESCGHGAPTGESRPHGESQAPHHHADESQARNHNRSHLPTTGSYLRGSSWAPAASHGTLDDNPEAESGNEDGGDVSGDGEKIIPRAIR